MVRRTSCTRSVRSFCRLSRERGGRRPGTFATTAGSARAVWAVGAGAGAGVRAQETMMATPGTKQAIRLLVMQPLMCVEARSVYARGFGNAVASWRADPFGDPPARTDSPPA